MSSDAQTNKRRKSQFFYCPRRTMLPQGDIYYQIFKKELHELPVVEAQIEVPNMHKEEMKAAIKIAANLV